MSDRLVVAIVGPTCTGKTALSIHLASVLQGEVIGCDSRTIYRYMDIGTAKPSVEERAGVPHHLFDIVDPDDTFTVSQYKDAGTEAINAIHGRNHVPLVVGGTGLYARALLEGLQIPPVAPQEDLRASLNEYADKQGNTALHERLRLLDPVTAERLNANDRFRVVRAIEVSTVLGQPFSEATARVPVPFHVVWIGLTSERDVLKKSIEKRMDVQVQIGMVEEVRRLYERYGKTRTLMNAVNYKELIDHFEGNCSLEYAIDQCILHNVQLARRQMMWFKTNNAINWFNVDFQSREEIENACEKLLSAEMLNIRRS